MKHRKSYGANRPMRRKHGVLTCDCERGGALVRAMYIGGSAAVSATVLCGRVQQLQRGSAEAADNPVLFPVLDGLSVFEPLEGHVWSILSLTLKFGCVANADVDGADRLLEHRLGCDIRGVARKKERGWRRKKERGRERERRRKRHEQAKDLVFILF